MELPPRGGVAERVRKGGPGDSEKLMPRFLITSLTVLVLGFGLSACDEEVEVETPAGEVELEED